MSKVPEIFYEILTGRVLGLIKINCQIIPKKGIGNDQ
jgi:hypothetical protein